jgi:uncharacterized protein (UPF0332 family)
VTATERLERARRALESADLLLAAVDFEGAVNRAYYAMFYAAHAALARRGIEVTSSKHGTLVTQFGLHLVKTGLLPASLGRAINDTLALRQRGDYQVARLRRSQAERAVREAAAFVAAIQEFLDRSA